MRSARPLLPQPSLILVTDMARLQTHDPIAKLEHIVREAVTGGVNIVQLREKQLSHEQRIAIGQRLRDAIAGPASPTANPQSSVPSSQSPVPSPQSPLFFVNGDIDAAIELRADGVHLPADAPDIAATRRRIGAAMLLSVAAHSIDDAARAEAAGADILQIGTVFASASHPGDPTLGIAGLRAICAAVRVPVIAIGGITATNAGDVLLAGAAGVAVISTIFGAEDPRAASESLRAAISAPVRA